MARLNEDYEGEDFAGDESCENQVIWTAGNIVQYSIVGIVGAGLGFAACYVLLRSINWDFKKEPLIDRVLVSVLSVMFIGFCSISMVRQLIKRKVRAAYESCIRNLRISPESKVLRKRALELGRLARHYYDLENEECDIDALGDVRDATRRRRGP